MSVKMALTKLCACACGGAIIGGGAMHVAQHPRPRVHHAAVVRHKRVAPASVGKPRVVRRAQTACVTASPKIAAVSAPVVADQGPLLRSYSSAPASVGGPSETGNALTVGSPVPVGGTLVGIGGGYIGGGTTIVTSPPATGGGTPTPPGGSTPGETGGDSSSPAPPVDSTPPDLPSGTPGDNGAGGSPHPVPAPPMVLMFGLGAATLVVRARFANRKTV